MGRREWDNGQMCIIYIQADNTSRGEGRHVYAERDSGREDPVGGTMALGRHGSQQHDYAHEDTPILVPSRLLPPALCGFPNPRRGAIAWSLAALMRRKAEMLPTLTNRNFGP